jgi:hypothetical protein
MNISTIAKSAGFLLLSILLCCPPSLAGTITYLADPTGAPAGITGKAELKKLGSVTLGRGRVTFTGNEVDVTVIPEWQFDRESVLSGYLLHTSAVLKDNELLINGLAYFDSGDWLSYIDDPKRIDAVTTNTGEVRGKINSVTPFALEMTTEAGDKQTILLQEIADVDSARVYHFSLPAMAPGPTHITTTQFEGQSANLTMSPTTHVFRLAALKKDLEAQGDGDISTRNLILISSVLAAANMAQCLPEIFMLARQPHWSRLAQSKEFETLTNQYYAPQYPIPVPFPRGVAF